jgi:hypothetical protein
MPPNDRISKRIPGRVARAGDLLVGPCLTWLVGSPRQAADEETPVSLFSLRSQFEPLPMERSYPYCRAK